MRTLRYFAHLLFPKGTSPIFYRKLVSLVYRRLIYDSRTQTVIVRSGPLIGFKKYGPFKESDFDFALGQYEPEVVAELHQFCRPGMTVFDIGANAGYLTLLMSKLVGDSGHVHAFEPIPQNSECLLQTLQINRLRNVAVHQMAISAKAGRAQMNFVGVLDGFASLVDGGHDYYRGQTVSTISVATISLDQFCNDMQIAEIDLIKMDIEGAELLALAGMSKILAIQRPVLIIEFWGARNIHEGIRLLGSQGYDVKVLSAWNGIVRGVKAEIQNILALPL
jgi:FkbM family methyltransferase